MLMSVITSVNLFVSCLCICVLCFVFVDVDSPGVSRMLYECLQMCDGYLRKDLQRNMVVAGGTSMAKGFGERMRREMATLLDDNNNNINDGSASVHPHPPSFAIVSDSQRKYAAWIGASMYASLPTFKTIQVTAEQYKRDETVVHKKFFG